MKMASTSGPTVTNEQLDELIARDEAAQGPWERSFEMKYHALRELRTCRNNSASVPLTSPNGALTDQQLDYLIRIGRRNLQEDPDSADCHGQALGALKELRALRR